MKKPEINDYRSFDAAFRAASRRAGKKQYTVPYFIASHPGSDLHAMIDLALFLKRNGYRPDQVQDFIPAPFDIATCMYYTGIDPFTGEAVATATKLSDRKMQRALLQFFKPENYFEVRKALLEAGRGDLIGNGCDALIPAQPPARRWQRVASTPTRRLARGVMFIRFPRKPPRRRRPPPAIALTAKPPVACPSRLTVLAAPISRSFFSTTDRDEPTERLFPMSPRPSKPKTRTRPKSKFKPKAKALLRRLPVPGRPGAPARKRRKHEATTPRNDAPRPATLHVAPVDVLALRIPWRSRWRSSTRFITNSAAPTVRSLSP